MSWDIIARALFVDNGAAAGLAKFNTQVHDVAKAAPGGTRGLFAIETGLRTLALEAVGIQGPLGRVAEGLLKFGGGSGLVLGAAAGIGLVAGAYKLASQEFADTEARIDKLNEQWRTLVAQGKPLVTMHNQLTDAVKKLGEAQDRLTSMQGRFSSNPVVAGLQGAGVIGGTGHGTEGERAAAQAEVSANQRVVNELRQQIADFGEQAVTGIQQQVKALEASTTIRERAIQTGQNEATTLRLVAAATAEVAAQTLHLTGTKKDDFIAGQIRLAQLTDENRVLDAQKNVLEEVARIGAEVNALFASPTFQAGLQAIHVPTEDELFGRTKHGTNVNEDVAGDFIGSRKRASLDLAVPFGKQAGQEISKAVVETGLKQQRGPDVARIAAESVALIGALRQGGPGGALSSAGALTSELGAAKSAGGLGIGGALPGIGIGLSIAGGLINAFDNSAERRHREEIAWLKRIAEKPVPEAVRVQPIFVGASPANAADVAYQVGRFQDRDGVPRGVGS